MVYLDKLDDSIEYVKHVLICIFTLYVQKCLRIDLSLERGILTLDSTFLVISDVSPEKYAIMNRPEPRFIYTILKILSSNTKCKPKANRELVPKTHTWKNK